jgi:hypothetical protein
VNRSSRKAHAPRTHGLSSYARQLLHAFAEAGQPSSRGLQLLMGPNGGLMWTDSAQVDRSEQCVNAVILIPESSAGRVQGQSPAAMRPEEPASNPIYTPVEAAMQNLAT